MRRPYVAHRWLRRRWHPKVAESREALVPQGACRAESDSCQLSHPWGEIRDGSFRRRSWPSRRALPWPLVVPRNTPGTAACWSDAPCP